MKPATSFSFHDPKFILEFYILWLKSKNVYFQALHTNTTNLFTFWVVNTDIEIDIFANSWLNQFFISKIVFTNLLFKRFAVNNSNSQNR